MLKDSLRRIALKAVEAVRPNTLLRESVKYSHTTNTLYVKEECFELKETSRCHVVGFGKAVLGMAEELYSIMGQEVITSGVLSVPEGTMNKSDAVHSIANLKVFEGAKNNLPDENSLYAASKIKDLAMSLKSEDDLLLVLISGGGSALLPAPIYPLSLNGKLQVIKDLSFAGATIQELNTVRIALSELKGGKLAQLAHPARVVGFILSDIIGDPLDLIASGPTILKKDSKIRAKSVFEKYSIPMTPEIKTIVEMDPLVQSPDSQDSSRVTNILIGNNTRALEVGCQSAENLGFNAVILSDKIQGISREVGSYFVLLASGLAQRKNCDHLLDGLGAKREILNEIEEKFQELVENGKPLCLIGGGETVVKVTGKGKGGRNQEMVLAAALTLKKEISKGNFQGFRVHFLSIGTDGIDGPTDAAGAVIDVEFTEQAILDGKNLEEFLADNNSYEFFRLVNKENNLIKIGHTGTNVMDVHLLLISQDQLQTLLK